MTQRRKKSKSANGSAPRKRRRRTQRLGSMYRTKRGAELARTYWEKQSVTDSDLLLLRFGPYIKARRKKARLSLRGLGQRAGMAYSNVFQLEELHKNPRLTELHQLALAFNQSLAQFLKQVEQLVQ